MKTLTLEGVSDERASRCNFFLWLQVLVRNIRRASSLVHGFLDGQGGKRLSKGTGAFPKGHALELCGNFWRARVGAGQFLSLELSLTAMEAKTRDLVCEEEKKALVYYN